MSPVLKKSLRRSTEFELSWAVYLLKILFTFYVSELDQVCRAALELRATPQLNFIRTSLIRTTSTKYFRLCGCRKRVWTRVARFFLEQPTKMGKINHKIYQRATKYIK
jgi:hypothetical protein